MEKSKILLTQILDAIVTNTAECKIGVKKDDMGILFTVKVSREDMGRIIGKEGSVAKAIRTLLRAVGMSENARVTLKIDEPDGSTHVRKQKEYVDDVMEEVKNI